MGRARVDVLYVNIGRGHPFYLDGIVQQLDRERLGRVADVFGVCRGPGGWLWHVARGLYRWGSSCGGGRPLYSRLRAGMDYAQARRLVRALGRSLETAWRSSPQLLLISHPLLVAALGGRPEVVYQHGELAVPREALVPGLHHVLVPDAAAAEVFVRAGHAPDRVQVTGLCVEASLATAAPDAFARRCARLDSAQPLTGAYFSSGAEPRLHVATLAAAACDAVARGGAAVLFAQRGGRYHAAAMRAFRRANLPLPCPRTGAGFQLQAGAATLALFTTRTELESHTAMAFPQLDYVLAPAHERSHWALGLGLPLFIVEPSIGSFAPLNQARLLAEGVAEALPPGAGAGFGPRLEALRQSGGLTRMAQAGWGRYDIQGFANAARWLEARV